MKINELIENLKYMENEYGNLDVVVDLHINEEYNQKNGCENLFVNYNQRVDGSEDISIQNYPY